MQIGMNTPVIKKGNTRSNDQWWYKAERMNFKKHSFLWATVNSSGRYKINK